MHVEPDVAVVGVKGGKGRQGQGQGQLVEYISVPVLDLRGAGWVEVGTVGAVVVAFLGLCWVLFGRATPMSRRGKTREKEKKNQ